jgi:Uncharacterized conserved protein
MKFNECAKKPMVCVKTAKINSSIMGTYYNKIPEASRMQLNIPYGDNARAVFDIPDQNFYGMLEPAPVAPADDPVQEIENAIDNPIDCPPLKEIIKFDRRVNIICDDLSRPTPVHLILPVLIGKLKEIGVGDGNIKNSDGAGQPPLYDRG